VHITARCKQIGCQRLAPRCLGDSAGLLTAWVSYEACIPPCSLLVLSHLIYYRVTAGWGIFHPGYKWRMTAPFLVGFTLLEHMGVIRHKYRKISKYVLYIKSRGDFGKGRFKLNLTKFFLVI
jgi:hypothetical protein